MLPSPGQLPTIFAPPPESREAAYWADANITVGQPPILVNPE